MVAIAQLAERLVVVLKVAGSSPVSHPTLFPLSHHDNCRCRDRIVCCDMSVDIPLPRFKQAELLSSVTFLNACSADVPRSFHPHNRVGKNSRCWCTDSTPFNNDKRGWLHHESLTGCIVSPIPRHHAAGSSVVKRLQNSVDDTVSALDEPAPAGVDIIEVNDCGIEPTRHFVRQCCFADPAVPIDEDDVRP